MTFRPLSDVLKVATFVLSIKVREGFWGLRIIPHLSENVDARLAEELLANGI
jgi:hypothetical protein